MAAWCAARLRMDRAPGWALSSPVRCRSPIQAPPLPRPFIPDHQTTLHPPYTSQHDALHHRMMHWQVDVFGVHPGLVDSPLMDKADTRRHLNAALIVLQNHIAGMPTWRGSLPALYAATEPKLKVIVDGSRVSGP